MIRELRCLPATRRLLGEARRQITTITNYLEAHLDRLRYDEYLTAGYAALVLGNHAKALRSWRCTA